MRGRMVWSRAMGAGWLLALAPAAMLLVLLLRSVWDVDIFWQLKLGEMILANGGPLAGEPFAALHVGEPLPAVAWLGQAVMAQVRLLWGWTGLRVFDALCWLGGILVVAAACRRRGASQAGLLLAIVFAFFAALPLASIRPQSFAVLGFGILLALLRLELKPWRMTIITAPLLLLWQNLHPSISVAVLALSARAGVRWWQWLRGCGAPPWELTLLAVIAAAAMLATPDGVNIFRITSENASASVAIGATEWLPLWVPANWYVAVPVLLVATVVAWLLLRNPGRIDWGELAAAVALLAATVLVYRFVLFWAIALIPVVARGVPPLPDERRLPAGLSPLLLLAAALLTPWLAPTRFVPTIPLAAIDRLRALQPQGTVFVHFPWGGPAIDAGYPGWRVAYDGRYYRYTPAEWDHYRAIASGGWRLGEIDRLYHPVGFVLSPTWDKPLVAELSADGAHWRKLSQDAVAVAFARRSHATVLP